MKDKAFKETLIWSINEIQMNTHFQSVKAKMSFDNKMNMLKEFVDKN
jgi:hypothetical protein